MQLVGTEWMVEVGRKTRTWCGCVAGMIAIWRREVFDTVLLVIFFLPR